MYNIMPRIKLTQQQMELIALLPKAIRQSKDFTNAQKLVLGNIIEWYGTEFSKRNDYMYRSDDEMMSDTGIKDRNTIRRAIRLWEEEGLITVMRGYRSKGDIKATEYCLTEKYYQIRGVNKGVNKPLEGVNSENDLKLQVEAMQQEIRELREEVQFLRNEVQKSYSPSDTLQYSEYNRSVYNDYLEKYNNINSLHSNASNVYKDKLYNTNSMKEEKIKRKEESLNDSLSMTENGEHGSEGFSDFNLSKDNKLQDGQDEHSDTSSARSGDKLLYTSSSNKRKDFESTGEDSHPSSSDKRSGEIEISARPATVVTMETVNGILTQLDEYYSNGASVVEYEPQRFKVGLSNPITWHELANKAYTYLLGRGLNPRNLCVEALEDPRYCNTFNIYDNI